MQQPQGGRITSKVQYGKNIDWISRYPGRRVKDHFFDPQKASPKPSEARGLHPTGAPRGTSRSGSTIMMDNYQEHRRTSLKNQKSSTRPSGARELDGGRSTYFPAKWGPRTRETTLFDDSATTTRRVSVTPPATLLGGWAPLTT